MHPPGLCEGTEAYNRDYDMSREPSIARGRRVSPNDLTRLLRSVAAGRTAVPDALERLKGLPYEDLGFARVDHHRQLRRGFPEVVFGEGKTPDQCAAIVDRIAGAGQVVLVTRSSPAQFEAIRRSQPRAVWHESARLVTLERSGRGRSASKAPIRSRSSRKKVPIEQIIVMTAGTSDIPIAEEAALTAQMFGAVVGRIYDVGVAGLHRLVGERARLESAKVIIVAAGMEGALPSVVAGMVGTPVIGLPTSVGYGVSLGGLTALFGMLNTCAGGLTVVNIDNGFGAGAAAAMMTLRRGP